MKKTGIRRVVSTLLAVALLTVLVPALAAQRPANSFVLVAEGSGRLVIAPEYVEYTQGQNISEALAASGHTFSGLQEGAVHTIDGVTDSYKRSDQTGSYALDKPAAEITHYCFRGNNVDAQPSQALQALMTAMADYLLEPADVQAAAKTAYDAACSRFVGVDDAEAKALCEDLQEAVAVYQEALSTSGTVHFTDGEKAYSAASYSDVEILLENTYGRSYTDEDGDGTVSVPRGEYNFTISTAGNHIQGTVTVGASPAEVSAAMPQSDWLVKESFALSAGYGDDFAQGAFLRENWEGRTLTVPVLDTFSGTVYTYAEHDAKAFSSVPAFSALYRDSSGAQREVTDLAFGSNKVGPDRVLAKGSVGNTVIYRVTAQVGDYAVSQDYTVEFCRTPTLTGISLQDQSGVDLAATEPFAADKTDYIVKVVDTVSAVTVLPVPMDPSYAVTVNDQPLTADGVTVDLSGETAIKVVVSGGGYSTTYTLTVQPGSGQKITIKTNAIDVTVEVTNSNGLVLPYTKFKDSQGYNQYQYTLVPGETYYYVATCGTYFHATNVFTLEDAAGSTIAVDVKKDHWLTGLAFSATYQANSKGSMEMESAFSEETHRYSLVLEDTESVVCIWVNSDQKDAAVTAEYIQNSVYEYNHGVKKTVELTAGQTKGTTLQHLLLSNNPYGNTLTIRLSREENGVTYYQDYQVDVTRKLSLQNLEAFCGGSPVLLYPENEGESGYTPAERAYTLTVPMAADTLVLNVESYVRNSMNVLYGDDSTGYRAYVDGVEVTEQKTAVVQLDGTLNNQTVVITVTNDKTPELRSEYVLTVKKAAPTVVTLHITPADALMCVHERESGNRIWPEDGTLMLSEGFVYDYALTRSGYVGRTGSLLVTRDEENALVLMHNDESVAVQTEGTAGAAELTFALEKAAVNDSIRSDIPAQWPGFRGGADNNGVTDAPVPMAAEDGTLYWAIKLGEGTDADAVGSPIIVDGDIIIYAGGTLYRVDPFSGEILASGEMDHKSSFSITPPTYYEGMIFVALSDGTVQAFNAETLESLWIYNDPLGGQPNSPIAVCDGYLYTGFWNQENQDANFVCLTVTDEDPAQPKEKKAASWYHTHTGGYYWAGAYACADYVLVGADDGRSGYESATARLLLFDARSGKLLDSWDGLKGDVRTTVSYDSATDAFYFAAKGGYFCSVKVTETESGWRLADKWQVALSNGSNGVPMSTSTPVVYNGRAYIGVSGAGQFSAFSGHNITVIDLTRRAVAYSVPTKGYPQTSGLLTTAYEESSGSVYVYFLDNYTPGKVRVLRDKAGQTSADYITVDSGYSLAYDLFSPNGDHAQYAICSPIVDEYGTMYFKNDSGYLMAFGSMVEKIEITRSPDCTDYMVGEMFNPAGMEVTATLKNGKTRDVTDYVTWSEEALTLNDSEVTVIYPHVLYHNAEDGTSMTEGVSTTRPTATVSVTVTSAAPATKIEDLATEVGKVTVTFDGTLDQSWRICVAAYSGGKMLQAEMVTGETGGKLSIPMAVPAGADELRAFVLDGDSVPVMQHKEISLP